MLWPSLHRGLIVAQQKLAVFFCEMRFSLGKPTGIEISLSYDENVSNDQALWVRWESSKKANRRYHIHLLWPCL
jgi:hypothetical protein